MTQETNNNNFNNNIIKTFSTRNKSSLSISTADTHSKTDSNASESTNQVALQHPQSSSSVGPNVAGRIGVGGNLMVDPYNPSNLSHRGTIGAGAFVYKVYNMLLDPSFQHLISFNSNGQSFTVFHVQDFSKTVLPKHFKHNNFSSFVRQLNMYGFHKVNKTPRGQRGSDNSATWEFVHPKFHRGRPDLLEQIRRKTLDHDSVSQSIRKDHSRFPHPQSSPTGHRFPSDSFSFLPNLSHYPPPYQLLRAGPSHLPHPPNSDGTLLLSPTATTQNSNIPDILNPPVSSTCTSFEGDPNCPLISPNQNHLLHGQSSDRYPNPFVHSPYSLDHPSSNASQTSSAPITPLSAVPPPLSSSPFHHTLDSNQFSNNPIELLMEMKNNVSNQFQGIHVSYEQLYQELDQTRQKQKILIDLVEKMYKTLQSIPNLNLVYGFPSRELSGRSGGETTPIFKITEHDYPDHSPMVFEEGSSQQQCPVSVGTSPSISECSHTNHTSPCDSAYRSFSVCPGGFGNLTLASYPNSPVGGLMSDHQQNSNKNSPHSPHSTPMIPNQSISLQSHTQQNESALLETEPLNRFLNPTMPSAHLSQQHMGTNELHSTPISPRAALSVALKTPLPPSPAPFKPIHQSAASINEPIERLSNQNQPSSQDYQNVIIENFIQSQQSNLSILTTNQFDQTNPGFPPDSSNSILVKNEDSNGNLTTSHNHSIQDPSSSSSSSSFKKMMISTACCNENSMFPSSSSLSSSSTTPNNNSNNNNSCSSSASNTNLLLAKNHHHINLVHSNSDNSMNSNLISFKPTTNTNTTHTNLTHTNKKRPASNSMDLSAGICHHLNHHNHNHNHNHQRN